ncbi:MAG: glycerophosphoryl diester phosphodiesterase membrane domain-containing protein [Pseudomonadota bacterium]
MTIETVEPGKLDIARVIQQTFAVLGRNFVAFFLLALILSGLPTGIVAFLQAANMPNLETGAFNFGPGYFGSRAVTGLAGVITAAILQGALIYGTVQDMNGAKASVGDCLATGLRAFLPLLGVSILFALAVGFGLVLLVVPGLMIACAWCVAVPSLVAERTGVFGAFSRSADLTRGNRWRIFALLVLVWVIAMVISAVIGAIVGIGAMTAEDPFAAATSPLTIASNVLINTFSAVITSTGAAVLYVELRRAREGVGPQWLADIFS